MVSIDKMISIIKAEEKKKQQELAFQERQKKYKQIKQIKQIKNKEIDDGKSI